MKNRIIIPIVILIIALIFILVFVFVNNKDKNTTSKPKEFELVLKDKIKATAELKKINEEKEIIVYFEQQEEGIKYDLDLKYYNGKKEVYSEDIIYMFPSKDVESVMTIKVVNETKRVKKASLDKINTQELTDDDMIIEKLEFDHIELKVQKVK